MLLVNEKREKLDFIPNFSPQLYMGEISSVFIIEGTKKDARFASMEILFPKPCFGAYIFVKD